jgi:hypothetical protein
MAGRLVEDGVKGDGRTAPLERGRALDREPQGRPQRPQVGRRPGPPAGLLGGHVRQRPERGRQRLLGRPVPGPAERGQGPLGVLLERGDAEVGQLGPAAGGDHHVGRFDVVVDDAGPVGRLQGVNQVQPDPGRRRRRQRPRPLDQLTQGRRRHQLHDQEQPPVGLDHVVEGDDPRMVEPGRGPGLPQRPLPQRRPAGAGGPGRQLDLLDGHRAAEQDVVGPPHRAHPAPAQRPPEDIAARDQPAVGARVHDAGKYGRSRPGPLTAIIGKL